MHQNISLQKALTVYLVGLCGKCFSFFAIMSKVKNTFRMIVAIFYEMKFVSFFLAITLKKILLDKG